MLHAVSCMIIGPNGRRIPAYPDIQTAYIDGLLADYYTYNPHVSAKTYYKYAGGTAPYPHFIDRHYGGAKGYHRTLLDMVRLAEASPSIILLRQIQDEVYQWVIGYLPSDAAASVCRHYISQNATRRDIAVYLADVMHYAITQHSCASRNDPALKK